MKTSQRLIIQGLSPLAILLLVSACNVKVDSPTPTPQVDKANPSPESKKANTNLLEGKWSSGCVPMKGMKGKMSAEFRTDKVTKEVNLYSDENCATQIMTQQEPGTFSVGSAVPELSNAYAIDFSFERDGMRVSEFSIFQVEGDHLYMGESGGSPLSRPTTVDRSHPLNKIAK